MDTGMQDRAPSPEARGTVQQLVREVQGVLTDVYEVKGISSAAEAIWDESAASLQRLLRIPVPPGRTAVYHLQSEGISDQIILFPEDEMEKLAHSSPRSRLIGDALHEMTGVIEETSHYVYVQNYEQQYGERPNSTCQELIAVIDKYNVIQFLSQRHLGRIMTSDEHTRAIKENALVATSASWRGDRPADYIIGHELGMQYVGRLINQHNQGRDVSSELLSFYHAPNSEQMRYLLYDLGFSIPTRSTGEYTAVHTAIQKMNIPPRKNPVPRITSPK